MDDNAFETAAKRQKASVKPEGGRKEGPATFVQEHYLPHIIKGLLSLPERVTKSAGDFYRTGEYDPGPALETAIGMAGARFPFARSGEAGVFGGKLAETADISKLQKAYDILLDRTNKFEKAELPTSDRLIYPSIRDRINTPAWKETDWYLGAEGKPRFEIKDWDAELNPDALTWVQRWPLEAQLNSPMSLGNLLSHPRLYEAYPEFKDLSVIGRPGPNSFYSYNDKTINLGQEHPDPLSVLLHEIQHGIQKKEDFVPGLNPAYIKELYIRDMVNRGKFHELNQFYPEDLDQAAFQNYLKTGGEVEARNVQRRAKDLALTYEPPWKTQDVPNYEQNFPGFWRNRQSPETNDLIRALRGEN